MLRPTTRKLAYATVAAAVFIWIVAVGASTRLRGFAAGVSRPFAAASAEVGQFRQAIGDWLMPPRRKERLRLRQQDMQLAALQERIQQLQAAQQENRQLRELLDMAPPPQWRRIVAPVVGRSPAEWNLRFRIGRGRNHGVQVGAAVLHDGAIIGRIQEIAGDTAVVQTIADPGCRLSVRASATAAAGILRGQHYQKWHGQARCLLDYMPRDQTYHRGQLVVTSGLTTQVPAGLRVGRLVPWPDTDTVARVVETVYAQLLVEPVAALAFFRHVIVLVREELPSEPAGGQTTVQATAAAAAAAAVSSTADLARQD